MPRLSPLEIGQRIETRRRDRRIKQEALATMVGMSQANLSRIECGEQSPDEYQLRKIETVLGNYTGEQWLSSHSSIAV